MNKEDYSKYYIQGSDHYLIPKDVFNELFNEMSNWKEEAKELKKQLEVGKEQYNDLVEEKEKLQERLTTYQILHHDCEVDNLKNISKIEEMEYQQKEFISYLENEIKRLEENNIYEPLQRMALETQKHNLSKYKEIIGVSK